MSNEVLIYGIACVSFLSNYHYVYVDKSIFQRQKEDCPGYYCERDAGIFRPSLLSQLWMI